jgi:hypothetical protein
MQKKTSGAGPRPLASPDPSRCIWDDKNKRKVLPADAAHLSRQRNVNIYGDFITGIETDVVAVQPVATLGRMSENAAQDRIRDAPTCRNAGRPLLTSCYVKPGARARTGHAPLSVAHTPAFERLATPLPACLSRVPAGGLTSLLDPSKRDQPAEEPSMDASGKPVAPSQIPARFVQCQPGAERGDRGRSEHVEWEVNAQIDARPSDREPQ